jgi:PKD domain
MRTLSFLMLVALASCGGCKKTPMGDVAPGNLADVGLVIDGPDEGATVHGRWISVSGWFDPKEVAFVSIVGAPLDGFYEATGHIGVPSVAVTYRKDGRFIAPRVPVEQGSNRISVIPLSREMRPLNPILRNITATDVDSIPATVVAEPAQGKPGAAVRLRASTGTSAQRTWQWDFDGDGTFDEESVEANHTWDKPGRYFVVARTQVDGAWAYGSTRFTVTADVGVLHSTHEVQNPSLVAVFGNEESGNSERMRPNFVVAIDGTAVKIFDRDLNALRTLSGFTKPVDVIMNDDGGIVVLDVGVDALLGFDATGAVDSTFGVNGKLAAPRDGGFAEAYAFGGLRSDTLWVFETSGKTWRFPLPLEINGGTVAGEEWPFAQNPTFGCGFQPPFSSRHGVEGGKICRFNTATSRRGVSFIDMADGPEPITGDFWALDSSGKLYLYRLGSDLEATYTLEYPVTALASGRDGQVYTAGPGVIEQRALPFLRYSANNQ